MTVAWGVLSTARIAGAVVQAARRTGAAEVVAVASRDGERARAFADRHGIARAHAGYARLLADPAVDAVYVPLPNALHVEWAVAALEAGKHVLCEKPLDRRPERVARAFDAAERAGLVLCEGFAWRHHPQIARLRALLAEGAVGAPRLVRACFSFALADERDIRLDPALDGGALMDLGSHCVAAARLVAGGEPLAVEAEAVAGPTGVDLRMAGLLRFDGGLLASVDCALDAAGRGELEVAGADGRIVLGDPWLCWSPRIALERGGEREPVEVPAGDPHALQLEAFAAAIGGDRAALAGREDALGQARAIDALYRSAAEGRAIAPDRGATRPG